MDCIKVHSERKNKEFLIKEKKIEQIPAIAKQDILELQEQLEQEILSGAKDDQKNS